MRTNLSITAIVVATIAVLAVLVPLDLSSHNIKAQASILTADKTSSPNHNMTQMFEGQDSTSSDQSNGAQDSDTQNTLLSKTSDNVTVDFTADQIIQTNHLAFSLKIDVYLFYV